MSTQEGLVIVNTGSFYTIKSGDRTYIGKLRGSFKLKEIRTTNPIAVGDWVRFEPGLAEEGDELSNNEADEVVWITELLPRKNYIIRRASNLSKQASIIAANLDRVLLIVTINYPVTSTTFIDRFLATAEAYGVEASLLFNKIDRYNGHDRVEMEELRELYEEIGYRCFEVSSLTGQGMEQVKSYLKDGVTLLSGHSGVGKSTFINALIPGADLRTAAISDAHNTGTHTTTYSEMIPLPWSEASYVIDTPGIKGFGTIEFEREEVGHFFPDIFEQSKQCRFNNCTHTHEPGCAVQQALKRGRLAPSRYKSYLSILNEDEEEKYRLGY